jgi:hypothetical protein
MIKNLKSVHKSSKGFSDFGIRIQYKDIADFFAKETFFIDYDIFGILILL